MATAAVIGSHYGDRNLGDAAISEVVRYSLDTRGYSPVQLLVFRTGEEGRQHGTLDLRRIQAWSCLVRSCTRPSIVVIGGGGILQNSTSIGNLIVHFLSVAIGRLVGARVILAGVGVGPLSGWLAPRLAGWTVRLAAGGCLVRDPASQRFCERWSRKSVSCAPDLAFALPLALAKTRKGVRCANNVACNHGRLVLCLRPPVGSRRKRAEPDERYLAGLSEVVNIAIEFARSTGRSIAFLPTHPIQDVAVWKRLCKENRGFRAIACIIAESPEDLLDSVQANDLVVGMRLHSIVFAAIAGASFVALGYDEKVGALARELEQEAQLVNMQNGWCERLELQSALQRARFMNQGLKERAAQFGVQALSALGDLLEDK